MGKASTWRGCSSRPTWPRVVGRREAATRTGRNEDDGVLSGPLGDSSERDGREHLAREHLVNVPHGGVREAPPPIFTVFGKIRAGLRGADFLSLRLPFALASLGGGFLLAGRFQTLL